MCSEFPVLEEDTNGGFAKNVLHDRSGYAEQNGPSNDLQDRQTHTHVTAIGCLHRDLWKE